MISRTERKLCTTVNSSISESTHTPTNKFLALGKVMIQNSSPQFQIQCKSRFCRIPDEVFPASK